MIRYYRDTKSGWLWRCSPELRYVGAVEYYKPGNNEWKVADFSSTAELMSLRGDRLESLSSPLAGQPTETVELESVLSGGAVAELARAARENGVFINVSVSPDND